MKLLISLSIATFVSANTNFIDEHGIIRSGSKCLKLTNFSEKTRERKFRTKTSDVPRGKWRETKHLLEQLFADKWNQVPSCETAELIFTDECQKYENPSDLPDTFKWHSEYHEDVFGMNSGVNGFEFGSQHLACPFPEWAVFYQAIEEVTDDPQEINRLRYHRYMFDYLHLRNNTYIKDDEDDAWSDEQINVVVKDKYVKGTFLFDDNCHNKLSVYDSIYRTGFSGPISTTKVDLGVQINKKGIKAKYAPFEDIDGLSCKIRPTYARLNNVPTNYTVCGNPDSDGRFDHNDNRPMNHGWTFVKNHVLNNNEISVTQFPATLQTPGYPNDFLDLTTHPKDWWVSCHTKVLAKNLPDGWVYRVKINEFIAADFMALNENTWKHKIKECSANLLSIGDRQMCEGIEESLDFAASLSVPTGYLYFRPEHVENLLDVMMFTANVVNEFETDQYKWQIVIDLVSENDIETEAEVAIF